MLISTPRKWLAERKYTFQKSKRKTEETTRYQGALNSLNSTRTVYSSAEGTSGKFRDQVRYEITESLHKLKGEKF